MTESTLLAGVPEGVPLLPTVRPGEPGFTLVGSIRNAFSLVADPELGLDLDTLGLLCEVELGAAGTVAIRFVFTTPFCPYGPALMAEMEERLRESLDCPFALVLLPRAWNPSDEVRGLLGMPGYW
jgi:metal-sulfur cluster biosynthetic enzyme